MAEFNSTRASAIVAHHALAAQNHPSELRFTEGTYHALELASPRPETRLEVRTYAAGAAFQYLDKDAKRRADFLADIAARFPNGVPVTVGPHTYYAQFADDVHGRDYVYGNWSLAENGVKFTGDQAEDKMAVRALVAVEVAKLLHPIAYAI
jgi:hypothetical protein